MSAESGFSSGDELSLPVAPAAIAASLSDLWFPRIVADVDDSFVKVARVEGTFPWHSHDAEDELFYVLKGRLRIEMTDRTVALATGELFVVRKGVRHRPVADEECHILLIERKSTLHTGSEITELTRSIADQRGE